MSLTQELVSRGLTAYTQGRLPEASGLLSKALAQSPDHLDANVLFGIVSARQGQRDVGIFHLRKAIGIDRNCAEAHIALSTLLFANGDLEQAIEHGEKAIALQSDDPETYRHLARDLIAHGRTDRAIDYLRMGLQRAPTNAPLLQDLAAALTEIGHLAESLNLWKKLTELHPRNLAGWLKLGGIYLAARRFPEASACGEKAVSLQPRSVDARILLGLALVGADRTRDAEAHLKFAITASPNEFVAQSAYGLVLQEMGRFEEARPYFERTIEMRPSNGQAYYSLLKTKKIIDADRPLIEKLKSQLTNGQASPLDVSYMHYALGKAMEDLGDYESSMGHYLEATSLAHRAWFGKRPPDRARYSETIRATIETFASPPFERTNGLALLSQKPILIVGMIRSGTTLVEQIVSSHRDVKGAGELTYWHDSVSPAFDIAERTLDPARLRDIAEGYLQLLESIGPGYARVTDKLPHNYTMLGFVLAAIPNARVIYVKRNPIDNCLSIFTTAFQHPPAFTLSRSDIVYLYREHERIMAHWKSVIPSSQLLEVEYEDIVQSPEPVTRRLIEFAGLEWEDACLYPERNERNVNTPSVWQVRQPIYRTSMERWRKFEPWLGEFRELLPTPE